MSELDGFHVQQNKNIFSEFEDKWCPERCQKIANIPETNLENHFDFWVHHPNEKTMNDQKGDRKKYRTKCLYNHDNHKTLA